jgi:Domain of unknown function (DUF927)
VLDARKYLARVLPWPENGEAYVNIWWTFDDGNVPVDKKGNKIYPWSGRAVRDMDEAMSALRYVLKREGTRDIYACMSTQSYAEEQTTKSGWKWFKARKGQQTAVLLKSLFIDVDVKEGPNGYPTQDEAIENIARFIKETKLPKPSLFVFSGGGIHVYWTLARPLTLDEWRPLAYALAEATKRHNLKCDSQCTVDGARVLRIPNTFNRKQDTPRPVQLAADTGLDFTVERLQQALKPYEAAVPKSHKAVPGLDPSIFGPPRPPLEGISELAAGIETYEHPPISIKAVAAECSFIRTALLDGGRDYSQPEWNLSTLIATFTEEGRKAAHVMGRSHPGYTKGSTDALYDRKEREKAEKGLGWPSCAAISAAGSKACQSCEHFAAGKTPMHTVIGTRAQLNAPTSEVNPRVMAAGSAPPTSHLPKGYVQNRDGRIMRAVPQEDGTHQLQPICGYSMEEPWLQSNPEILHFTSKIERGREKQISIPLEIVGSQEMRKHLQSQGFMLPVGTKATNGVSEFLMSWIKLLQETRDSVRSAPFGWTVKNGYLEGFVYGGRIWTGTTNRPAANPDPVIAQQYAPTGESQPWIDAARLVTSQCRPELDALVASAFAAPLVRFTGQPGVLMSAYSTESGIGKSTALKVAQSVWGDPIKAVQSLSDTQNAVMNKLGEIHSLPLYWDELKTEDDTRKFVNITFQMTQGKEKARMTRNVSQRAPGSWQTLLVSASNDSLLDYVLNRTNMTTAGLYRVFEYVVTPPTPGGTGQIEPSEASLMIARLNDNYGTVGLEYAKFLGANHQRVAKEVAAYLKALGREVETIADERYWLALIAVICVGARYANDLGFATFDLDALKKFMLEVLSKMRNERANQPIDMNDALNVSNVLQQFLSEMRARHALWTNRIHIAPGKPPKDTIQICARTEVNKIDGVYVQIGVDDKLLRISSTRLSEWLTEKGYSRNLFRNALTKELGMKYIQGGRIGAGTLYAGAKEYLLEIDLAGTPHANFIDEA